MPEPSTLLLFALAALALIAIPGPNHLYIVTRSLAEGRGAGVASSLGVETGTLIHIAAAAAGLSALVASSATAFDVVRYLGAAYLVYLGVRALRAEPPEPADVEVPATATSSRRAYLDGILVNVLNPKVALFFLAFVPQFVDPERAAATQVIVFGLVLSTLGLASNLAYVGAAEVFARRLRTRSPGRAWGRYVTGGIYLVLGAAAALTGGRRET